MGIAAWWAEYWQFTVGTLVGVVGTAAGMLQARRGRMVKTLDYYVVDDVELLTDDARSLRTRLHVEYDGVRVVAPRIVSVRIRNTGTTAIREAEYTRPVRIRYAANPPFEATVVACSPDSGLEGVRNLHAASGEPDVLLQPGLMNPGEWFDVQMISDGPHGRISVDARFADQSRPMADMADGARLGPLSRLEVVLLVLLPLLAALSVLLVTRQWGWSLTTAFFGAAAVAMVMGVVRDARADRALKRALTTEEYREQARAVGEAREG